MLGIGAWFARLVSAALARDDLVGWTAYGLLIVSAVAAGVLLVREIIGYSRLSRLARINREVAHAIETNDIKSERMAVSRIRALYSGRNDMKWGLSRFREHEKDVHDAGALLALAERELIAPLDGEARRAILTSAKRVSVVTAIYRHLGVTLVETLLAFGIGAVLGLGGGLWLALAPLASAVLDPYIKAMNSMPRIILAPIFSVWFGLGIASKVALGVTLVFFIVFFNVYQGVKEVSPVVLANARMLGANQRQLLRHVYLPSATSWVFSSLHTSVGLAFVGAVVGEYLGSSQGVGYLILQAEGTFDINTVMAGIIVLTAFALVLDALVGRIEKRLMKWQPKVGETEKL